MTEYKFAPVRTGKSILNVYPKAEQLDEVVQVLNKCLTHTEYLLVNCSHEFPDRSSLRALQNDLSESINKLKKLSDSKP